MFHSDTLSAVPKKGASGMGIQALDQQLKLHEAALGAVPCVMRTMITTCKRSAHRALQPALREAMTRAYQACLAEKGESMIRFSPILSVQVLKLAFLTFINRHWLVQTHENHNARAYRGLWR